jgi:molybdenum cofactor cytidylyltransferase
VQPKTAQRVLAVVILAAGRSVRMGRPKLLLPWGGTTVLGHLLGQWSQLGAEQIAVVGASGDPGLQAELGRLGFPEADRIDNPAPEEGMFSSIQCAARWPGWAAGLERWAIVLGDQPHLRLETLRAVLEFSGLHADTVCQPSHDNRPRHPVLLPRKAFMRLGHTTATNLKDFLRTCDVALCELNDPGLDLDLDRPEDYRQALALENRGITNQ